MNRQQYNALVEGIYDAAFDVNLWDPAIAGLKKAFNSIAAGFFLETKDHQLIRCHLDGFDPEQVNIYGSYYAEVNPWFTVPGLMEPGRILTDLSLELLYKDKNAFLKTEMYQGWCKKQDYRHSMGGNLTDRDGNLLNFTFFRSKQAGYYTEKEVSEYHSLCGHLIKAVEMSTRIDGMELRLAANESTLNKLRLGTVALDRVGRIVHMNDYAHDILYSDQGMFERHSRIKIRHSGDQQQLNRAVDRAYKQGLSSTLSIGRQLQSALSISVIPSTQERKFLGSEQVSVTLFITDPDDQNICSADYLAERWCLSPQEARFASHLLQGKTIGEIADIMELTKNTAQWYSKQVMQKCGVNRQSQLVLKLMKDLTIFISP